MRFARFYGNLKKKFQKLNLKLKKITKIISLIINDFCAFISWLFNVPFWGFYLAADLITYLVTDLLQI